MSGRPKILLICDKDGIEESLLRLADASCDVVHAPSPIRGLACLSRDTFDAVYVEGEYVQQALRIGRMLESERILEGMPDGIVLLDGENTVVWGNGRLCAWTGRDTIVGSNFYSIFGTPEILGPDFCPFNTALATGKATSSTLRSNQNRYYQVHAAPIIENGDRPQMLVVTVRDVTAEVLQQQKLAAIHQAGIELADLTADELLDMSVNERIDLLKSNILHYTKDLLHFDVVEIRLLDSETCRLEPLLAVGMEPVATERHLYARPRDNGVTGFVAATGKSYMCENTTEDPIYIQGAKGAKSSLTVPLVLHDQVIGTFNVESPKPGAFTESDLQFLEIFSRDVAIALNTLELLVAEKASTAAASVEAIHSAVALPVDDILNDAVNVMERYIGHEPEVVERLQKILSNARDIKEVIQKVGQKMTPTTAHPQRQHSSTRPILSGRRILVADADENVRSAAHALLERYGCIVEAAHDGAESISMIRSMIPGEAYDVIIADIRLPDMSGYQLFLKLKEVLDFVPLVLMTGFGYDPGHSLVKARQSGLKMILYKPFRLDQLLDTVEQAIKSREEIGQS